MANSLNQKLQEIFRNHHDAYLVDVLGPDNCGLSVSRVDELRRGGLLQKAPPRDAIADSIGLGRLMEHASATADNAQIRRIRIATLPEARELLNKGRALDRLPQGDHPGHAVEGAKHVLHDGAGIVEFKEPEIPLSAVEPPRKPPKGTDGAYSDVYRSKVQRIVSYCRGLGNLWSEKLQEWIGEEWSGDKLLHVPKPDLRSALEKLIQEKVAEALKHKDRRRLKQELSAATGDMGRNWGRIANTELQAATTHATIEQSLDRYGHDARVAMVPESKACSVCKRVFLDENGEPIIWKIADLLRNGTNVGLPRSQWKATAYPVHPCCACTPHSVPPGMRIDARGFIRYSP